jgi:hypothetical protein
MFPTRVLAMHTLQLTGVASEGGSLTAELETVVIDIA